MVEDRSVLSRAAAPPDQVIAYGREPDQIADVRFGAGHANERPLVVLIHGGFWRPEYDRAHAGPMCAALAEAGLTVAALEYRRVPRNPDVTVNDILLALSALPEQVTKHNGRVLVAGHSAGGHLALWAASTCPTSRLGGVLALAPAADLQLAHTMNLDDGAAAAFLGEDPAGRADLDPARMPPPAVAATIIHGDADEIVPLALAESYVRAHPRTRLVTLRGEGHFAVIDPLSEAWLTVVSELGQLAIASGVVAPAR